MRITTPKMWQATKLNSVVDRYRTTVHEISVTKATSRLSEEILKFLGPRLIKFATFIVPNVIACRLLRAGSRIEDGIVGPGLLLGFSLLREFSICTFLPGLETRGVSGLKFF